MSGIFPNAPDGGIAPSADPANPAQAYSPATSPQDTDALYYGNGCEVRLRPHVVNSIISEIEAVVDRASVKYKTTSLQNLEIAIRYLIQRGFPHSGSLVAQDAWHFAIALDPVATSYTDWLTLNMTPDMAPIGAAENVDYVRINTNSLGYVPLLRSDGTELQPGNIKHAIPFLATYFGGAFYLSATGPKGDAGEAGAEGPMGPPGPAAMFGTFAVNDVIVAFEPGSGPPHTPVGVGGISIFYTNINSLPLTPFRGFMLGDGGGYSNPYTGVAVPGTWKVIGYSSPMIVLDVEVGGGWMGTWGGGLSCMVQRIA